jgi:hypothetical protein
MLIRKARQPETITRFRKAFDRSWTSGSWGWLQLSIYNDMITSIIIKLAWHNLNYAFAERCHHDENDWKLGSNKNDYQQIRRMGFHDGKAEIIII